MRQLASNELNGRVAVSKPLLRSQNKRKRLLWTKKYKHYSVDDWKKVLFTDESKVQLYGNSRRLYVRHRSNERMLNECAKSRVKRVGGSIQVSGCFSYNGVGDLYRINDILTKEIYHSILQRHAIPSDLKLCGHGFVKFWRSFIKALITVRFKSWFKCKDTSYFTFFIMCFYLLS